MLHPELTPAPTIQFDWYVTLSPRICAHHHSIDLLPKRSLSPLLQLTFVEVLEILLSRRTMMIAAVQRNLVRLKAMF